MHLRQFLFLAFCLLLVGAGCGSEELTPIVVEQPQAPAAPTAEMRPDTEPPRAQAYEFCESQGYNIAMYYDEGSQKPVISCVFSNNTQCDSVLFYKGMCGPSAGGKIVADTYDPNLTALRYCDKNSPHVCGTNGQNYTNRCVATQQGAMVLHEGLCNESEQVEPFLVGNSSAPLPSDSLTSGQKDAGVTPQKQQDTGETATWLTILFDVVKAQKAKSPRSIVDRCVNGGEVYYYYQEDSSSGFAILYGSDGNITCFPNNDITSSCGWFDSKNRSSTCKRIWRDNR